MPRRKSAEMMLLHLDDPVTEFLPLRGGSRRHELTELPMGNLSLSLILPSHCHIAACIILGKYIVCGEAMTGGRVYQTSCFETRVERLEPDSKIIQHVSHFSLVLSTRGSKYYYLFVSALQVGVQVIIVVSIVLVMFVIFYAILYQMCKKNRPNAKSVDLK